MMYRATSKSVITIASRCTRLSAKKLTLPNHYAPSVFRYAYHHFSSSSSVNPVAVDIATAGGDMASSDISDLVAVTVDTPRSDEIITHGADAALSNISSLANTPIDGCVVIDAIAEISPYENPTHIVMYVVDQIHHFAGIPYWEAIMITTLMLRITLVPAAIVLLRDVTKLKMLRSEIKGIKESFNGVTAAEDPTIRFKYLAKIKELFIINKLNPLQTAFLSVLQFPIFLYVFLGLRSMGTYFPEFSSGGALWFTDLSVPDPYFLLPALNACSFLLMVEISSDGPQTEQQKSIKNVSITELILCGLAEVEIVALHLSPRLCPSLFSISPPLFSFFLIFLNILTSRRL